MRIRLSTIGLLLGLAVLLLAVTVALYQNFAPDAAWPFNVVQLPFEVDEVADFAMWVGLVALVAFLLILAFVLVSAIVFVASLAGRRKRNAPGKDTVMVILADEVPGTSRKQVSRTWAARRRLPKRVHPAKPRMHRSGAGLANW